MSKKILFLSALDFKEKSIQVIRKTPEAFRDAGWEVRYIVARDNLPRGNYGYEAEINPAGIRVERFAWPLARLRNTQAGRALSYVWTKIASLAVVLQLALRGAQALRREAADVIYGYEVQGVLAARLLKMVGASGGALVVHRFQGTSVTEMLEGRQRVRQLVNLDQILALRSACDLVIMTDDGTKGNEALRRVGSRAANLRFWVNGADEPKELQPTQEFRRRLGVGPDELVLVSVSRLAGWKRVDRGLAIAEELKRLGVAFVYLVVGGGSEYERLERLSRDLGIADQVIFTGPVPQSDVYDYMNAADVFISTYDMSNVGNPLLEAIRMGKLIVTLRNGATGDWITHGQSGLIYDPSQDISQVAASDIARLVRDAAWADELRKGVRAVARERLWTWRDRMNAEVSDVEMLLEK
ncbi:glycosyltransferase family 4 protein [Croceibacterium soli]|nr:glycosyltransferase family 4 protein [Croceibacterium soli]